MRPEEVQAMRSTLMQLYGLEGTLPEQYLNFMKRAVFGGNFGPSLAFYPTPVNALIGKALPCRPQRDARDKSVHDKMAS